MAILVRIPHTKEAKSHTVLRTKGVPTWSLAGPAARMSATLRARVVGSATTESGEVVESEDMAAGRRRGRRWRKVQGGGGPAVGFRRREARERWRRRRRRGHGDGESRGGFVMGRISEWWAGIRSVDQAI